MALHEWEPVDNRSNDDGGRTRTERMDVPGGWLYRCQRTSHEGQISESMVFVAVLTDDYYTEPC